MAAEIASCKAHTGLCASDRAARPHRQLARRQAGPAAAAASEAVSSKAAAAQATAGGPAS